MTLADIQREIAALPPTLPVAAETDAVPPSAAPGPLQVVSKQGRLILRLSAALEALEMRYKELAENTGAQRVRSEEAGDALRMAERRARQMTLEAIHLMDALDWAQEATRVRGDLKLAEQIVSAQRDCLRRLAALGVTEISAPRGTAMDGRLHEGLEAVPDTGEDGAPVPQYHILSLVRRGYQCGTDILRRAEVVTAA